MSRAGLTNGGPPPDGQGPMNSQIAGWAASEGQSFQPHNIAEIADYRGRRATSRNNIGQQSPDCRAGANSQPPTLLPGIDCRLPQCQPPGHNLRVRAAALTVSQP